MWAVGCTFAPGCKSAVVHSGDKFWFGKKQWQNFGKSNAGVVHADDYLGLGLIGTINHDG